MNTLIRQAGPEDAAIIHDVMIDAFTVYKDLPAPTSALQETIDSIRDRLESGTEQAALFIEGQEVLGAVRFHREDGLYFSRLSVRPRAQGRGIAKALIAWLEQRARQQCHERLWCRVRMEVPRNISLYESLGYAVFEKETVHRDGMSISVVQMEKRLCLICK